MSEDLFADVRKRAAQVQVATADEGTAHFGIVFDGNYVRPATDLERALSHDVLALLEVVERVR